MSVLSLIDKQLSNYYFRKRKYRRRRNSESKKLSQVLRNIDTFCGSLSQFFLVRQFANVFPCQIFSGNKLLDIVFVIRKDKAKEKASQIGVNQE